MIQTIDIEALLERADKLESDAAAMRKVAKILKEMDEPAAAPRPRGTSGGGGDRKEESPP